MISDNHPADIKAPRTAPAIATRAGINAKRMEPGPTRPKQQRLCAHALKLKEKKNNPLLFNYVFNKDEKRRNSAIQTA